MHATEIPTTRFGRIAIEPCDVLHFPEGIPGLHGVLDWVLLADADHDMLGWLQSTTRPDVALAVVSPRRFVPDYQVRLAPGELRPLALDQMQDAFVVVIVSKNDDAITLNLKAPVVINSIRRIGRQVVNNADLPLQYELSSDRTLLKKSA